MERRVNYMLIGGVFFAILLGLIAFILWFGRLSLKESGFRTYTIHTTYDIAGLTQNTPIKYKGITIGHIKHIDFDTQHIGQVNITLLINSTIPIATGSSVLIDSQGLAGLSYLSLHQNPHGTIITNDSDAILTLEQSFFGKLSDKADSALAEVLNTLASVEKLLSPTNVTHIQHTLARLDSFSAYLPTLSQNLNRALESINTQLDGAQGASTMIAPTLYQAQKSLQHLDELLQKATNFFDNFDKNPYPTLFGERK